MTAPAAPFLALLPHGMDWIWILLVVLLIFGPKKLPDLARGIGRSLGEFRKAKDDFDRELKESMKEPVKPAAPSPVPFAADPHASVAPVSQPPAASAPTPAPEPKKEA